MNETKPSPIRRRRSLELTYAAVCLALALVLPFLTGQIPQIGQALSPMHIPALLCGFICGPIWGLLIGAVAPILRSLIFTMPPMAAAIPMAFELAAYGALTGLLWRLGAHERRSVVRIYGVLVTSMVCGRLVWGLVKWAMAVAGVGEFGFAAFLSGAITGAIPGIIVQLILVPIIVLALERAGVINGGERSA